MANLNSYHLATWADSAKTRNHTGSGSSHENMWLHVRLRSMTYEVKFLIDQGNLPNYNSTQLNSRLTQRPYPATITQIHYHLTRREEQKAKSQDVTLLKNSEELTKKEHPFITYINKTEVNKVMVHIEEVEVNQISMKVLTQPQFLNDDVMDAYIQCLRYKEKGIREDGKAFLELALKIGLLNVEGAHVKVSKPREIDG
uniref:Uncharacterized protein n=1 Tax=Oryza nivara TaxID=4536 RepID=A0A0E0GQR6_ORYNI